MPDFGDGSQREDWGSIDGHAPSVANGQITPAQWAEYQSKRRKDALLGILGVLGGATGLGAAGMALGGGAGAAGSAAGSATINGLPMAPYAATATMSAPAVGVGAGLGAAGAAGAGAGAGAAGAAGAAGGAANTIANVGKTAGGVFGGMDSQDIMGLIAALTGTVGAIKSNPPSTAPTSATTDPAMQELIAMMQGRLRKSEPMFDSVQAMANGLLPTRYQNGGRG